MASSFFGLNMTALIQHLAERHNMTLCSTIPDPTSSYPSRSTSNNLVFYSMLAGALIIAIWNAIDTFRDQKKLKAKDMKINALKASNADLVTVRERFRGRIVQLFSEKADLRHILLGGKGMGVPLRVTIDGKTVIVRIDPEKEVDQWDTPLTPEQAAYKNSYPRNHLGTPAGPLRINTAVDRRANPQDIPPAPSPADPSFFDRRFEQNIPGVDYSNIFGERYPMPATRSTPSAGSLQNNGLIGGYPTLLNAPFAFPTLFAEAGNVAPEHTLAAHSAAIHQYRPSPFNNPYPAARGVYSPLPPAAYYNTVPNTPRPELETLPAETDTGRSNRYASVEDGSDNGVDYDVDSAAATVATEDVNEVGAGTVTIENVNGAGAGEAASEEGNEVDADEAAPEEGNEDDRTMPEDNINTGDDIPEDNDDAELNDWLDITEDDWDNAGS